jgi:hypothetical protein
VRVNTLWLIVGIVSDWSVLLLLRFLYIDILECLIKAILFFDCHDIVHGFKYHLLTTLVAVAVEVIHEVIRAQIFDQVLA